MSFYFFFPKICFKINQLLIKKINCEYFYYLFIYLIIIIISLFQVGIALRDWLVYQGQKKIIQLPGRVILSYVNDF